MGLFWEEHTDGILWGVWKMEEPLEALLALLPQGSRVEFQQQLSEFSHERRRLEWLAARVLLYLLLKEEKQIDYLPEGKPYLRDHSYFISISHTKGYVAVILSAQENVGIDIEQYSCRVHKVSQRFVRSDEEIGLWQGNSTWSLLLHWSAKEAVFKCMPKADADLRKLRLLPFVLQQQGSFQVREYVTERQEVFPVHYRIHPDFVLTWVAK